MEQSSFERIFGEYLEEPYHSLFKECELLRIDADRASGEIRIQAKSDRLIEMGHINQCALQLAQKANLKKVGLTMKYLPTLFTAEYLPSIVCELKTLSGVVNGFFEGAEAELSGQELLIRLKNGGREILQQAGVDKLIEKIVRDHFSLSLAVSFLEEGTLAGAAAGGCSGADPGCSPGSGTATAVEWWQRWQLFPSGRSDQGSAGGDLH